MVCGYEFHQSYPINANEKIVLLIHLFKCFVHKNVIVWLRADVGLPQILFGVNMVLYLHLQLIDIIFNVISLLQNVYVLR